MLPTEVASPRVKQSKRNPDILDQVSGDNVKSWEEFHERD